MIFIHTAKIQVKVHTEEFLLCKEREVRDTLDPVSTSAQDRVHENGML